MRVHTSNKKHLKKKKQHLTTSEPVFVCVFSPRCTKGLVQSIFSCTEALFHLRSVRMRASSSAVMTESVHYCGHAARA